jgi:hypothetical protein
MKLLKNARAQFVKRCCFRYRFHYVFKNVSCRDANKINDLLETPFFAGDTAGTHSFQLGFFSPSRSIATTFPWAWRLAGVIACA